MTKVALITGANKGLGLETARQLGKQGIHIIAAARNTERLQGALESLKAEGITAHGVQVDMADPSTFGAAVELVEKEYGHLDILINNAGVMIDSEGWADNTSSTVTPANLRKTFDINFFGLVELTQLLLPLIRKSEAGRIVNLSSILGSLGLHADPESPVAGTKLLAYNSSKAALNMFTIHLAAELKDTPIQVNSAHPGWVKTDMGGEGAMIDVEMGAKTAVDYALAGPDGPRGEYAHLGDALPW
ncbi:MAG: SDR family oxidoreductase [Bacteroidota bacterium]